MKAAASLRHRLLLGTLLWIIASIGVTGWVLQGMFEQHLSRQFHAELAIHLNQLAANLEINATGQAKITRPLSDPRLERPYSGLYWQVDRMTDDTQPGQAALLRSRSLWDSELQAPDDRLADNEQHEHRLNGPKGESLRMIERSLHPAEQPTQTLRLIVAADEKLLAEPVERFSGLLLMALGLLALGLIFAAVIQVFAGLRPLKHLRDELTRLRDGEQALLGGNHPSEIQPLVDELNTVLQRNADFVERARSQAGNLAHAVKTPLAVMANAAAMEQGELADLISHQISVAQQHIDHHLAHARIAASAQMHGQHCQLRPALEGLLRVMQRVHAERELWLQLNDDQEHDLSTLIFRGEAQDLQEMLGNLLDNACKWAKSRVEISATRKAAELIIDIDDDGPGINTANRPVLMQRGQRGDEKIPGSGLGLAIVDDLANLYGGQLALLDSPLGGLRVRLCLPAGKPKELG